MASMESLSSILSFTAVKFPSPKLSPMASTAPRFPSFSVASMTPAQRIATTSKRSAKPSKTVSVTPPTPTSSTTDSSSTTSFPPKKVLVPIGFGTEEMEAVIIVDVLRRAGADVTVASVEPQLEIEASGGIKLVADTSIKTCSNQIFDLVVLPGGMPGSVRLRDSEILQNITSKQAEEKRLYGAICAAPAVTLLPWGLLRRKQTTCHPAFMDKLPTFWAVRSNIQVSRGLTTSRGPGTSFEFALCLVEQLFGESVAREVGELLMVSTAANESRKKEFNTVEWSLDTTLVIGSLKKDLLKKFRQINCPLMRHSVPGVSHDAASASNSLAVLIPIADGSEEIEVVTIADILRRAKVDVVVASVERSLKIKASQGTRIIADKLIGEAAESVFDLIILPGGIAGAEQLNKSRILKKLLKEQKLAGRMYGAVCSSPQVLHGQGLLKDKKVTAHSSIVSTLTNEVVDGAKVVIDGKLITSRGLATVTEFTLAVVSKLFGHARARSVAEGLVYEYPRS